MKRPDLKAQLDALPRKPGVYRFLAGDDEVLYVGKAGSLRNRVRSYFHESAQHSQKTEQLVALVGAIDWIVTQSELEALLLEMNLIKAHRPPYNVMMKDDKRYPVIKVSWSDPFPKVSATRRTDEGGARYYGPYISAAAMYETLHTLRRVFPYLTCNRTITGQDPRSCLYDDMDLCLAPCTGKVSQGEYRAMIAGLCRFLDGGSDNVLSELRAEMREQSESLAYEQAARTRDRIAAVEKVVSRQRIIAPSLVDQDVIALARDDGEAVVQVFFVRDGKLLGREYFRLRGAEDEQNADVLAAFVKQFYDDASPVPGEIVLPECPAEAQIIEHWLGSKRGTRVRINVPRRGRKRELVDVAVENAAETLRALQVAHGQERSDEQAAKALEGIRDALGLARLPCRMECFDISNIQGTHTVGSMVVFENAVPRKSDYRHFRVRAAGAGDDFAAMEEVLDRRFQRLARRRQADAAEAPGEKPGAFDKTPDLVIVDGGKGQLGVALRVVQRLGLDDLQLAALAKREEEVFRPGEAQSILLPGDSQGLFLLQRLRDEAHRFAIGYYRKLHQQDNLRSTLDAVPGVGAKRRRALLLHFGSLERIRQASVDELASVPGMTRHVAEQVKSYL